MTRALPGLAGGVTLGTVPYVALKISWLAGGVGLRDPALMRTTTYVVANSITLVLDLIVVALAWVLALAARRRLLVVLAPLVWGATGLMVTPVRSAAVIAVAGEPSTERLAGDALQAWVYVVVYVGFAVQGRRYCDAVRRAGRTRLALALRTAICTQQPDPGRRCVGWRAGWSRVSAADGRSRPGLVRSGRTRGRGARSWAVTGLLCLAGALGSAATVRRFGLFAIVSAWLGTGAMVCWSGYTLLVAAVDSVVAEGTPLPLTAVAGLSGRHPRCCARDVTASDVTGASAHTSRCRDAPDHAAGLSQRNMMEPFTPVTTVEQLEAFGIPAPMNRDKVVEVLEDIHREWIAATTLVFVATSSADGRCDVSPKGDPAGFVRVLGPTRLAIPERPGNRRMDGFHNILENPHVGLVCLIPGRGDTLRINGRAQLITDLADFDNMVIKGHRPSLALLVDIEEVFFHCPRAFRRSRTWDPEAWRPTAARPYADIALALWRKGQPADEVRRHYAETVYNEGLYASQD